MWDNMYWGCRGLFNIIRYREVMTHYIKRVLLVCYKNFYGVYLDISYLELVSILLLNLRTKSYRRV